MRSISLNSCFAIVGVFAAVTFAHASDLNLHPAPSSRGCPVELTVSELPVGKLLPLKTDGTTVNRLHILLRGAAGRQLRSAEISVRGFSADSSLTPASTRASRDRKTTFHLDKSDDEGGLMGDIALDFLNVSSVRVDAIEYIGSNPWHPSADHYCVAAPGRTTLLGSLR